MRKLLFPLMSIFSIALVGLFASFSKPGIYKLNEQTKSAAAPVTYYRDADNDTYGNPAVSLTWAVACDNCGGPPTGYVTNNLDCDDNNNTIYPGGPGGTCGLVAPLCGQVWADKNLDVSTYRDGTPIPQATTDAEWIAAGAAGTGAWCYYPATGTTYGKLYNWYAVNDPRGLAPAGFHIPTDAEWSILSTCLGGDAVAGGKMKSTSGWNSGGNGTNTSGFTGLPGGLRFNIGPFGFVGFNGGWWSATEFGTAFAWFRFLGYDFGDLGRNGNGKQYGFSVRCLRD